MAPKMCVAIVVAAMLFTAVAAQTQPDCTAAVQTLIPCYAYVTGSVAAPGAPCCQSLITLNTNNPICLCASVSQLDTQPQVNRTRALGLAKECNVAIDAATCPALATPPLPSLPPTLPPLPAVPPTMFTPPAGPVSGPKPSTPPAASGPSSGGAVPPAASGSPSSGATSPGPSPPSSGASAIRFSLALCVAAVGVLVLAF
ncbi:non-specific lipid transfer protein GPI-anchored 9 [Physcomitrium patens]|uniref:Bifunctional inhibitor/plant lipid transfer protein/seed storage helical domain-containing protein n=1 Tax=Physcomitrium patens TaxID=3218 RepID=A0A2K1JTX1_PHYPA|nr:classical arabinogalactan protein 2-like [Physcomitrium patens]PNR44977.1 hypothetical protein PHYPA_014747 [Physcomitrium patens]|eukprot:XP_024388241.1 classical arabinogalactan protein 2-like [Physcomitrella patens]